jgi:hypothetical protein
MSVNLGPDQCANLLQILKLRFDGNMPRHQGVKWSNIEARLAGKPSVLKSLHAMEESGGEPDVVSIAVDGQAFVFCDCSPESPVGRRSACYDSIARQARKEHRPDSSAEEMATSLGIELLTEEQYHVLQTLGEFDLKTSSWLKTPESVRAMGGALFGDRRYGRVFVYHNGAQSYYAARGFRGLLRLIP